MHPNIIPIFILSPKVWVINPTIPGPKAPPKSPAIARYANIAVPPSGMPAEEMLMVPGHMIATEKPHIIQPIRPMMGFAVMDAII